MVVYYYVARNKGRNHNHQNVSATMSVYTCLATSHCAPNWEFTRLRRHWSDHVTYTLSHFDQFGHRLPGWTKLILFLV